MRILIFSDSHNYDRNMAEVITRNIGRFDLCIHLGDGCREFELMAEKYAPIPFVTVNGNGEDFYGSGRVNETVLDLEGYRVLITHGHRYNVKFGTTQLLYRAQEQECDIVLYGHTHLPDNRFLPDLGKRGIYIFNPGSISRPPFGHDPGYGVLELTNKGVMLNAAHL